MTIGLGLEYGDDEDKMKGQHGLTLITIISQYYATIVVDEVHQPGGSTF